MALVGELQVTAIDPSDPENVVLVRIGLWSVVRQEDPPGDLNSYKAWIQFRDINGVTHTADGVIWHTFSEGALKLTEKVMAWAQTQINQENVP